MLYLSVVSHISGLLWLRFLSMVVVVTVVEVVLVHEQMIGTCLDASIVVVLVILRRLIGTYMGNDKVVLLVVVGVVAHAPMVEVDLVLMQPHLHKSLYFLSLCHLKHCQSPS